MQSYHFYFLLFAQLISSIAFGQTEEEILALYEHNITQEYLNNIYIPEDVMDAMKQLDLLSDDAGKEKLREAPEEIVADKLILGLGRWMIVNWNFYEGSRLSHALKQYGVSVPEDQAKFMIISYHRYLRGQPLELEGRGQRWYDLRKKEQEERLKSRGILPK